MAGDFTLGSSSPCEGQQHGVAVTVLCRRPGTAFLVFSDSNTGTRSAVTGHCFPMSGNAVGPGDRKLKDQAAFCTAMPPMKRSPVFGLQPLRTSRPGPIPMSRPQPAAIAASVVPLGFHTG